MKSSKFLLALFAITLLAAPSVHAQYGAQVDANVGATVTAGAASSSGSGGIQIKNVRSGDDMEKPAGSDSAEERSGLLKNALGVEIRSAAEVMTEDDLDAFEENILITDSSVADADSSNKRVGVSYWHEGRLFFVIPVKVQSRTEVEIGTEDTLNISTQMPWWSFLVAGLGKVKNTVETELMASGQFTADVLAAEDAKARARALEAIASAHARVAAGE